MVNYLEQMPVAFPIENLGLYRQCNGKRPDDGQDEFSDVFG
jgi:hypothetical protein